MSEIIGKNFTSSDTAAKTIKAVILCALPAVLSDGNQLWRKAIL